MRQRAVQFAILAAFLLMSAADWPTDGGSPQRTNWQMDETVLSKENVAHLQILWKVKQDNAPREMHSLFPPLIIERVRIEADARPMLFP